MTVTEIANTMDLFRKFTMKKTQADGSITEATDLIYISQFGILEQLIKAMRYINKVISEAFVRDWCLKCCRYIKSTVELVTSYYKAT